MKYGASNKAGDKFDITNLNTTTSLVLVVVTVRIYLKKFLGLGVGVVVLKAAASEENLHNKKTIVHQNFRVSDTIAETSGAFGDVYMPISIQPPTTHRWQHQDHHRNRDRNC
jgi:hypothetical protein